MAHGLIALVASCLNIGLYTSPLNIAREIRLMKGTGAYSPIPYLAMALSCLFWDLYGWHVAENAIMVPCTIGLAAACLTLTTFLQHLGQEKESSVLCQYVATVCIGITLLGWAFLMPPANKATARLGLLGAASSICMFASPFATIKQVIKEKNSASLPVPMVTMSVLCTTAWVMYGRAIGDNFLLVPNALGLGFALIQLSLAGIYPSREAHVAVRPGSSVASGSRRESLGSQLNTTSFNSVTAGMAPGKLLKGELEPGTSIRVSTDRDRELLSVAKA